MNWQDTVIDGSQILKLAHEGGLQSAAEAQAELSFKAGYEQHKQEVEITIVSLADICEKHRQFGREDVVDWEMEDCDNHNHIAFPDKRLYCSECRQAMLKEWEI